MEREFTEITLKRKLERQKRLLLWEMRGFEDALDGKSLRQLQCTPQAVAYFAGYVKATLIMAGH